MKSFHAISEIHAEMNAGKLKLPALTQFYLDQIEKRNGRLNAFLSVYKDEALHSAHEIQKKFDQGSAGKLAGLVVGIKDLFSYKDHPLTCGSRILEGFQSQYSATVVERLLQEDAIIVGHQNCDEFAMGSSNENSAFGSCRNPIDEEYVPGGSSGGSAAAVAAGMCQVSIGSDTGGSVRQPAAFCGVIGLKPTYSRISRYGLAAYSSSFDTVGILSKSIEDAARVLSVIAGPDDFDSTVSREKVPEYRNFDQDKKYKIAYFKESLEHPGLDSQVRDRMQTVIARLQEQGHELSEVSFKYLDYMLATYYILTTAEASSNLSRYDGVRYGYRAPAADLEGMYKQTRTQGFGDEAKRRIMTGTFVLSASYYDAYYTKAQKVRRLIKEETDRLLKSFDFIASPTTPSTAFKIGEKSKDPLSMYLEDLFTVQANVAGIPAISVPAGTNEAGLPVGIQLMANRFCEIDLLDISNQISTLKL